MTQHGTPVATVGVFDAGIGGIPLAAKLKSTTPHLRLIYLGDAARRPYGPLAAEDVASYLREAERFFVGAGCDVWVIACHTASVVARRLAGLLPCVDMVSAVRHAAPAPEHGPVGLLATAGTVASGVYPAALARHRLHQVAAEELLRLAEEGRAEDPRVVSLTREAIAELRAHNCRTALLACTDFTCVIEPMRAVGGGLRLIDPLDAAAELTLRAIDELDPRPGRGRASAGRPDRLVLTGPHPRDAVVFANSFGLELPEPEYLDLAAGQPERTPTDGQHAHR